MGRLGDFARSLIGGNDHEQAETTYAGHESATDRANRKTRIRRAHAATKADRKGQAWDTNDRRKHGSITNWNHNPPT